MAGDALSGGATLRVALVLPAPFDGPQGRRVAGIASALTSRGAQVTVLAQDFDFAPPASIVGLLGDGPQLILFEVPRPDPDAWAPRRRLSKFARSWRGVNGLGDALRRIAPDVVIGFEPQPGMLHQMARAVPQRRRRLVDLADRHPISWGSSPLQINYALRALWTREWAPRRLGGLFVISDFLQRRYGSAGIPTLLVPPLFDLRIRESAAATSGAILDPGACNLVIAGTAPLLDAPCLRHTLNAAARVNAGAQVGSPRVVVHIAGHPEAIVSRLGGLAPGALAAADFHGYLEGGALWYLVRQADYVVQQRDPGQEWAQAGFPSKVVESWTLGTPVITNLVSDLGNYAEDGVNSIILTDHGPAAMEGGMRRALESRGQFDRDGIALWAAGEFAPQVHADRIFAFVASAVGGAGAGRAPVEQPANTGRPPMLPS